MINQSRIFSDWGRFFLRKEPSPIQKSPFTLKRSNTIEQFRSIHRKSKKRNTKSKQKIYHKSETLDGIEEGLENNVIICKTLAKMYEHIMNSLGINLKTMVDINMQGVPGLKQVLRKKSFEAEER